jgi:hippurate hydrolase
LKNNNIIFFGKINHSLLKYAFPVKEKQKYEKKKETNKWKIGFVSIMKRTIAIITWILFSLGLSGQQDYGFEVQQFKDKWLDNYEHLHQNPELSLMERKTSEFLYDKIRSLNFVIRRDEKGYGFVAILKNGLGPTLMYRTDMDALPMEEKTGLPYASKAMVEDVLGQLQPAMHACGHDMHMSIWLGVAEYLSKNRHLWGGTLVMVAQQAEEVGKGAKQLLDWGLYRLVPDIDMAIALHVAPDLPVGSLGLREGYMMANVDMVDITVYGRGGHGANPHETIDPVVLAARLILDLQSIVSREISPIKPAVLSIGAIHGGSKGNVIPDSIVLSLTLRSFHQEVRTQMIEAIERKCIASAMSAGLPSNKVPKVTLRDEKVEALYNNPELVQQLRQIFIDSTEIIDKDSLKKKIAITPVVEVEPQMVGEDFAYYGLTEEKVPIVMMWLGSVSEEKFNLSQSSDVFLPPLHSAYYYPDAENTLLFGVQAMLRAITGLMHVDNGKAIRERNRNQQRGGR